jgi:hypothetical protein
VGLLVARDSRAWGVMRRPPFAWRWRPARAPAGPTDAAQALAAAGSLAPKGGNATAGQRVAGVCRPQPVAVAAAAASHLLAVRCRRRFGTWNKTDCQIEECVEASTYVDVVVDLDALKTLLDTRLPLVFNGTSVKDAEVPWPPAL